MLRCSWRAEDTYTPNDLHTALKNDLVVIEEQYDYSGVVKGVLKRKNNRLVCEVMEWSNKLSLEMVTSIFIHYFH